MDRRSHSRLQSMSPQNSDRLTTFPHSRINCHVDIKVESEETLVSVQNYLDCERKAPVIQILLIKLTLEPA